MELISQLRGTDATVRRQAIEAAEQSADPAVIATLISLLRDPDTGEQTRAAIADVLGRNGRPEALQALQTGVTDPDDIYRGLCASGLANVHNVATLRLLIALLADKVNTVRNLAERSLLQMLPLVRDMGVEPLLALLEHPVPLTRSPAARLLGLSQDGRALGPLLDLLKRERQWLVRMWVVKGLGDLGFTEAFPALADRLRRDEKDRVRAAAAEAIGKIPHPDAEAVLLDAVADVDGGVRQHVEESLAKLRRARAGHDEPEEHHEPHFDE